MTRASLGLVSLVEYCMISDDDHRGRGTLRLSSAFIAGGYGGLLQPTFLRANSVSPPNVALFPQLHADKQYEPHIFRVKHLEHLRVGL